MTPHEREMTRLASENAVLERTVSIMREALERGSARLNLHEINGVKPWEEKS